MNFYQKIKLHDLFWMIYGTYESLKSKNNH